MLELIKHLVRYGAFQLTFQRADFDGLGKALCIAADVCAAAGSFSDSVRPSPGHLAVISTVALTSCDFVTEKAEKMVHNRAIKENITEVI